MPDLDRRAWNSSGIVLMPAYNAKVAKVLVVGLGQLGLRVAKYNYENGFDTYGYDITIEAIERANKLE